MGIVFFFRTYSKSLFFIIYFVSLFVIFQVTYTVSLSITIKGILSWLKPTICVTTVILRNIPRVPDITISILGKIAGINASIVCSLSIRTKLPYCIFVGSPEVVIVSRVKIGD